MLYIVAIAVLALVALAGWYQAWRAGRHPAVVPHHAKSPLAHAAPAAPPSLDLDDAQRQAGDQLSASIQRASEMFQKNLTVQALKINDELEGLAGRRLRQQVDDFNRVLDSLTATASASVGQLETLIDQRRKALEASMSTQVLEDKQRTMQRFYDRLSDVVASYIIESLGKEVDLSGQLPFVLKVLEDNQDIIKRDLLDDY